MPRLVHKLPKYSLHKATGQARATIQGKDHYLGPYGSKARKYKYDRRIAYWLAAGRFVQRPPADSESTIAELFVAYRQFFERHYLKRGAATPEQDCIRAALRPVRRLYVRG